MEKRTVTSFFDKEYLEYARYVVENRAIPSCIDGLKPTQRKIVYVANKIWKNGSEKPMKLFQLAGRVAADSYYHHGNCLDEHTIIHSKKYGKLSFKEWLEKYPNESLEILSYDEITNNWVYELSTPPFKGTKTNEIIEIELENSDKIKCTPDHLILLEDLTWIEARHLTSLHKIKSLNN
jgi:intein/homing endonuclease